MIAILTALVACAPPPPDIDLTGPPHTRPARRPAVRCLSVAVERVHKRGVSSPSITEWNTRMIGRTEDGRTVWWDFSRALWPGPPLAEGDTLFLHIAEDGAAAGIGRECPVEPGSP